MRRVTDKDIPKLRPWVGSWFVIRKATNEPITEIMKADKGKLKGLNADNVQIIPANIYLGNLGEPS